MAFYHEPSAQGHQFVRFSNPSSKFDADCSRPARTGLDLNQGGSREAQQKTPRRGGESQVASCGVTGLAGPFSQRSRAATSFPSASAWSSSTRATALVRPAWAPARGCKSPVDQMTETTSRSQQANCVVVRRGGKEGGGEPVVPRNTNRVEGGVVRASRRGMTKPASSRDRNVDAVGVRGRLVLLSGEACRDVGLDASSPDPGRREAAGHPTGVSRGRSSGGIVRREGPNAKPRQSMSVLAEATAANPASAGPSRNGRIG
jgi:hypothetical protein